MRTQIDDVLRDIDTIFVGGQMELIGVYLHGSLALGSFNPRISDIDLLVVSRTHMPVELKRRIIERLLLRSRRPYPIEISFLSLSDLWPWTYPTPYDLHFSEDHRDRLEQELDTGRWHFWNDQTGHDSDLAAHVTVTRERGHLLRGLPIRAVFPAVPVSDYLASILADIASVTENIEQQPIYYILNLCRVYAYIQEGTVLSKAEAGTWAMARLPAEIAAVVEAAHTYYLTYDNVPLAPMLTDKARLRLAASDLRQRIDSLIAQRQTTEESGTGKK